jgi:RNA polymerase sigma-70 factor (ECF subfamily)
VQAAAVFETIASDVGPPLDAEIVRRVLGGEPALFEVLIRRHQRSVHRTVRGILGDDHEVEDAVQQTYLLAYACLREFAGASSFWTWLTRIAINESILRLRRRAYRARGLRRSAAEDRDAAAPTGGPEHQVAVFETMRLLERALDALPAGYRAVFVLREAEEISTAETARRLGITETTVRTRLHRARTAMRQALGEEGGRVAP